MTCDDVVVEVFTTGSSLEVGYIIGGTSGRNGIVVAMGVCDNRVTDSGGSGTCGSDGMLWWVPTVILCIGGTWMRG
ncbi:hypothetical protein U1Q18_032285, partial [Sarracenia purpurea var. burkii]